MTDPTTDTVARMIRSAPDATSAEDSEELAERVVRVVWMMGSPPELEEIRHSPTWVRRPDVDVERLKRRMHEMARSKAAEYAEEDEESRTRRVITGVLEIIEAEVPLVGRARAVIEAVREAWGDE